ncbi:MAG TPA: molecular chaperone TorD family protein [Acidimicrobiales bacterium]|nr:molecular chaperone TorD family protein [Acidimicrobiales bacterium]
MSSELVRALAAICDAPAAAQAAAGVLGLRPPEAAEHTEVFVMNCPPYAAVHLGGEGGLGGEAADRVAGFWRALGLVPPAEPDHLSSLLALYAELCDAAHGARRPAVKAAVDRARQVLLWEHLWSWAPGYLGAVRELATPSLAAWAVLTRRLLAAELMQSAGPAYQAPLPLALRQAAGCLSTDDDLDGLLDALVAPVRSGIVLTRHRLTIGSRAAEVGHRIGERRFALRAMLEQSPAATLRWLAGEAGRWYRRHAAGEDACSRWWAQRARTTHGALAELAAQAADGAPARGSVGSGL